MKIAIGSDHGGFAQKEALKAWLAEQGHEVTDFGCESEASVDYPDYAVPVARAVADGQATFGVLVCGTGIGMQMAANKIPGIRAANIVRRDFAQLTREHNNANVLTLSGRFVSLEDNIAILRTFLGAEFAGGRHQARIDKIAALEQAAG